MADRYTVKLIGKHGPVHDSSIEDLDDQQDGAARL